MEMLEMKMPQGGNKFYVIYKSIRRVWYKMIICKALGLLFFLFLPGVSLVFACYSPPEQYSWSDQKLIYCTEDIFIGTFDGESFVVEKTLKGNTKFGDKKKNYLPNTGKDLNNILSVMPNCSFSTRFDKNQRYIVFLNSTSKKSYMLFGDKNASEWLNTISRHLSDKKYKSDCRVQYNLSPYF